MKDILMFSGGLDSLIAWYYLGQPQAVYAALGHKYQTAELNAVLNIREMTGMNVYIDSRLNLQDAEQEDAFIPMRNSFLAHIGALYGDRIWLTVQKGEMNIPDRSKPFFKSISKTLTFLNDHEIIVDSPFWNMNKTDMVRWYVSTGLPLAPLMMSSSCYKGNSCGECPACFRRWVALELNGIQEPYRVDPWTTKTAKEYLKKAKEGTYGEDRAPDIIEAMKRKGYK